jgi:hypothetical protein
VSEQKLAPSFQRNTIPLSDDEQRYLEQLNAAILYAQQSYFQALAFFRRVHNAPEGQWALNNINVGFERIEGIE